MATPGLASQNGRMSKSDKYLATDRLGSGPTCDVYLGRDVGGLNRKVAIKRLRDEGRLNAAIREPFFSAAQRWSELTHEGLAVLLDLDRPGGSVIYEPRPHSASQLLAVGPASGESVVAWLKQLSAALDFLHHHRLLHLNIKPTNILIDEQQGAKLIDGRCVPIGQPSEVPLARGAMRYLAPELTDGDQGKVGPAADIYALGMVMLELLIGPKFEDLYRGVDVDAIDPQRKWLRWQAGRDEHLPPIVEQAPGTPDTLQRVLTRMLDKDPAVRLDKAGDIHQALIASRQAAAVTQPRTTTTKPVGVGPLPKLEDIPVRPTAPVVLRFFGAEADMIGANQDVFTVGSAPTSDFAMPAELVVGGNFALRFGRGAEGWRVSSPNGVPFYLNQDFVPSSAALRSGDVIRVRPGGPGLQFTILNQNVESLAKLANQFAPRLIQTPKEAEPIQAAPIEASEGGTTGRLTWGVWWVAVAVLVAAVVTLSLWPLLSSEPAALPEDGAAPSVPAQTIPTEDAAPAAEGPVLEEPPESGEPEPDAPVLEL